MSRTRTGRPDDFFNFDKGDFEMHFFIVFSMFRLLVVPTTQSIDEVDEWNEDDMSEPLVLPPDGPSDP